ncbi:MAG: LysR family transcriptional regulator [Tissierellia bacterium]|nr:LysR family transcriptional regulator [Tissierellia bacterium]
MNLKNLQYFIQVIRSNSFTKASEDLFVSQSTISKAVKKLEDELNCRLLNRSGTQISLTKEGEVVLKRGEELLLLIGSRTRDMEKEIRRITGHLIVGISPIIATSYFGPIVYNFKQNYPDTLFQVIEAGGKTIQRMVQDETIDIGILRVPVEEEEIESTILVASTPVVILPKDHLLAEKREISLLDLKNENFIILDDNFQLHDEIIEKCQEAGFDPHIVGKSYQWEYIIEKVRDENCISILPKPILKRFDIKDIVYVDISDPKFDWNVGMAVQRDKIITREMEEFMEYTKYSLSKKSEEL